MSTILSIAVLSAVSSVSIAKIFEIYSRDHFHDYLQDLPRGSRYASVVAFYAEDRECDKALSALPWTESDLPSVEHLFLGQYEMSTSRDRIWYQYEEHLDLPRYLGVDHGNDCPSEGCDCPILAFIPSSYADDLDDDYLRNPSTEGVALWNSQGNVDWTQWVLTFWNSNDGDTDTDWKSWVWKNLEQTVRISIDIPFDFEITIQHQTNNKYLRSSGTPWVETVAVDAVVSFTELTVFPGDTIQITSDPKLTGTMKTKLYRTDRHSDSAEPSKVPENPIYAVHAAMDILNVVLFEDDTWGFDDDRIGGLSAKFIRNRHSTTLMTHTRNLVLPQILPATHSKGFIKRKMPEGLHERLVRFYRKWYHLKAEESWSATGTQLNYFKVKTNMISLDHDSRERDAIAHDVMEPMLLEWAHSNGWTNITGLEFTAFYGIREYSRGASLRNHVDRVDTHVLSAVLQIAQTGVEEPWPLQVIGFDGKMYDVVLEPGEMILYEGHRLPHGRPYPFNGTRFSNAFIHFKPKGWDWTTSRVWKHPVAKRTLGEMHMDMRSIYA